MEVSKFVQSANTIVFSLQLEDDGLHLIYSNECCCKLICAEFPYQRNEHFSNYIDTENYNKLLHTCESLGSNESFQATIEYTYKDVTLLLKLNLFSIDFHNLKLFFVIGTDMKDENVERRYVNELDARKELIDATIECIFTIQVIDNDSIILLDYNKYFLSHFIFPEYKPKTKDLRELFPPYVVSFLRSNCVLALEKNTAICKNLKYQCTTDDLIYPLLPKNKNFHIQASFIPFRHSEFHTIICCFTGIDSYVKIEYDTQNLVEEYNALFGGTINAAAIFNCETSAHPKLEKINAKMLELIVRTSILQDPYFYESEIFNKMLTTCQTVEDLITIHNKHSTFHYKIILIPVIRANVVKKAIAVIVDTTRQVNKKVKDAIHLTPRESEIINYVLLGEKNEYIAQKLNVSTGTVKRTLSNAYNKLGISSRVELINYFHSLDFSKFD